MSFFSHLTGKYFEKIVTSIDDLPIPNIDGKIYLDANITYRFQGLTTSDKTIVVDVSNTLMGQDKSNDGYNYTGTGNAFEVVNQTVSVVNMLVVITNAAAIGFNISNNLSNSFQIRECILTGVGQAGIINGGNIIAINNNIHSTTLGYGWDILGTVNKLGVAVNYFENGAAADHLHLKVGDFNIIKIIDNDFTVTAPNIALEVDNDVVINNLGGGSIVGNTFEGDGTEILGVSAITLDWIVENNGRNILDTSATVTQRKVRSEEELDIYLALPDPTQFSYLLDAAVFEITKPIVVPGGGTNGGLTFFGLGNNFTQLKMVGINQPMFTGGGNLFLNDMIITAEATGSSVFGMVSSTNFEAVELVNVNFQFCESLGFLDGFRQGLIINGFLLGDKQGLEFRGTWSGGMRISDSRFIFTPTIGSYMFKSAVGQTFGSRFVCNANSTIGTGSIGFDFTDANFVNDAAFQLNEAQFNGGGTYVNGITRESVKSKWSNCVGVQDTFEGGVLRNNASATTLVPVQATYYELLTSTTLLESAWFQSNSATNFHFEYVSSLLLNIRIDLVLALQARNNNELEVQIRKYDPTNTTFVTVDTIKLTSNGGSLGDRVEPVTLPSFTTVEQGERIRIFIRNNSDNRDILCEESSKLIISKR